MWGYPEFYIPVPGGYGTEAHSHLVSPPAREARDTPGIVPTPVPETSG